MRWWWWWWSGWRWWWSMSPRALDGRPCDGAWNPFATPLLRCDGILPVPRRGTPASHHTIRHGHTSLCRMATSLRGCFHTTPNCRADCRTTPLAGNRRGVRRSASCRCVSGGRRSRRQCGGGARHALRRSGTCGHRRSGKDGRRRRSARSGRSGKTSCEWARVTDGKGRPFLPSIDRLIRCSGSLRDIAIVL